MKNCRNCAQNSYQGCYTGIKNKTMLKLFFSSIVSFACFPQQNKPNKCSFKNEFSLGINNSTDWEQQTVKINRKTAREAFSLQRGS